MGNIMTKVFHNLRDIIDELFFTNSVEIESSNGPTIQEILNTKINKKSSSMSIFYLNEGHHYLKTSNKIDLLKSIENYTKSIVYAEPDSQEYQHAYAARSVALFNIRLISESLNDINNISLNNYPNYLKSELYYGKAMCCQILYPNNYKLINDAFDESEKWIKYMKQNHQEKMLNKIIKQKNAELIDRRQFEDKKMFNISSKLKCKVNCLPYYSDNIEINYSRNFGKYLLAKKNINKNELLIVECKEPYVEIIHQCNVFKYCWNCGVKTYSSVPCYNCTSVIYCSAKCREIGWNEFHDIECRLLSAICDLNIDINDYLFMTLRLTIKALREFNYSFYLLKKNIQHVVDNIEKIDIDKLDPDKFTTIFILSSYFDDENKYSKFSDVTKQMASLLTTTTNLLERSEDENVENSMTFDEKYIFLIELLHICLRISECSSISIGNIDDKLSMIVPAINLTSSNLQKNNDKIRKIGIMTTVVIKEGRKIKTSEHCVAKIW